MTRALEDYLEAILVLEIKNKPLHSVDIAKHLKVTKPAVTRALNDLADKKYVIKNNYHDVVFTKKGREKAKSIYHRHITIKKFLIDLGVNEKTAEIDCCQIEHVISKETLQAIERYLKK